MVRVMLMINIHKGSAEGEAFCRECEGVPRFLLLLVGRRPANRVMSRCQQTLLTVNNYCVKLFKENCSVQNAAKPQLLVRSDRSNKENLKHL